MSVGTRHRADGSSLKDRTILLHTEQGIGDMVQFIRYAPLVEQRGAKVVLAAPPLVAALFSRCPGVHEVISEEQEGPLAIFMLLL